MPLPATPLTQPPGSARTSPLRVRPSCFTSGNPSSLSLRVVWVGPPDPCSGGYHPGPANLSPAARDGHVTQAIPMSISTGTPDGSAGTGAPLFSRQHEAETTLEPLWRHLCHLLRKSMQGTKPTQTMTQASGGASHDDPRTCLQLGVKLVPLGLPECLN